MRTFSSIAILALMLFPAMAFADAGHAPDEAHGTAQGQVHVHEDGTVEAHNDGGFVLAAPWSARWWNLVGVSLILMGILCIWVNRYLQVS